MLNCSREKNEGVIIPQWGGESRGHCATPDLSYYWDEAREVVVRG